MKKTRRITTTVTVQTSDEEFVPKVGEVPNESAIEHRRRIVRECYRRFIAKEENRIANIRRVVENRRRKRLEKKYAGLKGTV